jgi:hypothetical protein
MATVANHPDDQLTVRIYNGQPVRCLMGAMRRCPPVELGFMSWLEYYCAMACVSLTEVQCCARECISATIRETRAMDDELARISQVVGAHVRYCCLRGYWNTEYIVPLCCACCVNAAHPRKSRILALMDNTIMIRANKTVVAREYRRLRVCSPTSDRDQMWTIVSFM